LNRQKLKIQTVIAGVLSFKQKTAIPAPQSNYLVNQKMQNAES
jgi:hypothetical protein